MQLAEECKGCLFKSQLKKVENDETDSEKLAVFRNGVRALCANPPADYCSPLLMRDINRLHTKIFGHGIDYSREKSLFNNALLKMENEIFDRIFNSADPIAEALKFAMAANYIDFARLSDLNENAVGYVMQAAERAVPQAQALESFKQKLITANRVCVLHDNCGEIVLDKILIKAIKKLYPQIAVISVVRGSAVINDVTESDAEEVGLYEVSRVINNGTDVPGTYLKEISPHTLAAMEESDIIISKGLGNLETLYGERFKVFYTFTCKCEHIAKQFGVPLWSAVFIEA